MITKALLVRCRCHLRVPGAGRSCQRSSSFSRFQGGENHTHVAAQVVPSRYFSQSQPHHEDPSQYSYCSEMSPHIRSCLSQRGEKVTELSQRGTGFSVAILGSGGGMPSTYRNTCATVLRLGGTSFLFDAGEGLQRQLAFSKLRTVAVASSKESPAVHIYGPPGLHTYIAANLSLSCAAFAGFTVVVHELVGGQAGGGPTGGRYGKKRDQKNIFLGSYPDFASRWIVKRRIDRNDDGTWTIENPPDLSVSENGDELLDSNHVKAGSHRRMYVSAAEVTHLPGVQTFGFVVEEPEPLRKIDPEKATKLGVRPGPKYGLLKNGFPVMSDDNSREIRPESVLLNATMKARKFALIGDNCGVSPAMAGLCQDADVLVHEATVSRGNAAAVVRGHSSPEMAGAFAKSVNAKALVLNHISPIIDRNMQEQIPELIELVRLSNGGVSRVVASYDYMELVVPRLGFDADIEEESENEGEDEGAGLSL